MTKKLLSVILFIKIALATELSPSYTQGEAIFDLSDNKLLYTKNFNQLFNPASLQKLFTAYAALKLLGPEYIFTTKISTTQLGDLVLQFSGDPTLTTGDLEKLFEQVKLAGITNIIGNIVIIGADYDYQNYGPGWMWDELDDCYAAPVSNFIINKNCSTAHINSHAQVTLTEPLDIPLKHKIYFSNDPTESCRLIFEPGHKDSYLLSGCIPYGKTHDHIDIALRDPELHIKNVIVKTLAKHNITFKNDILIKKTADHYQYTHTWTHSSDDLASIILVMLKQSDNMIAESLYKKVGQIYHHSIGSWENGRTAVLNILANNNIILDDKQLKDGSGLSRYNTLTPNQVIELLKTIKHDQKIFPILFASLPIAGVDGTLAWLKGLPGKIHAKTGSINNAYNLAGYFSDKNNDYAFVIMTTGLLADIKQQKQLAAKTITNLLQHRILND